VVNYMEKLIAKHEKCKENESNDKTR
jgi:hypothetical protein